MVRQAALEAVEPLTQRVRLQATGCSVRATVRRDRSPWPGSWFHRAVERVCKADTDFPETYIAWAAAYGNGVAGVFEDECQGRAATVEARERSNDAGCVGRSF